MILRKSAAMNDGSHCYLPAVSRSPDGQPIDAFGSVMTRPLRCAVGRQRLCAGSRLGNTVEPPTPRHRTHMTRRQALDLAALLAAELMPPRLRFRIWGMLWRRVLRSIIVNSQCRASVAALHSALEIVASLLAHCYSILCNRSGSASNDSIGSVGSDSLQAASSTG